MTDHETNVAVAKALGYSIVVQRHNADIAGWRLVNKDGKAVGEKYYNYAQSFHPNRNAAWQDVPGFVNDMTAAWEGMEWLRSHGDCDVSLGSAGSAWCVEHALLDRWYGPLCARPGEAICHAVLLVAEKLKLYQEAIGV